MKFLIQLILVVTLCPLIAALNFENDCSQLSVPVFAEKNGWVRIGCKTDEPFGYCTLERTNPALTCKIEINNNYNPEMKDCQENARINFTGNATMFYCEFEVKNIQQDGKKILIKALPKH